MVEAYSCSRINDFVHRETLSHSLTEVFMCKQGESHAVRRVSEC